MTVEYFSDKLSISYPLVDVADSPADLGNILADAQVRLYSERDDQKVYLVSLSADAVLFEYEDATTVFSGASGDFSFSDFGPWRVLQWSNDSGLCKLVVDRALYLAAIPIAATNARLVDSCVIDRIDLVEWIDAPVEGATTTPPPAGSTIILREGYNCLMEIDDEGTGITLNADAGAGLGRWDACEEDDNIWTFNGAGGDDAGDFKIEGDDCFQIIPLVEESTTTTDGLPIIVGMRIVDLCDACCECADYVRVYRAIRKLFLRLVTVNKAVNDARAQLKALGSAWNIEKTNREITKAALFVVPSHGWAVTAQGYFVNNTDTTLFGVGASFSTDGTLLTDQAYYQIDGGDRVSLAAPSVGGVVLEPSQVLYLHASWYWSKAQGHEAGKIVNVSFAYPGGSINKNAALLAPKVHD